MRNFCILNKSVLDQYSDKSISVLVALMNLSIDKSVFVFNEDYLYEYFNIYARNTSAKKLIKNELDLLIANGIVKIIPFGNIKSLSLIELTDCVFEKPYIKIDYDVVHKIFSAKTNMDKYKILLVYLNIIKWFHGDDGYSFPTNIALMEQCKIKSEVSLMHIQDFLCNELTLLCMRSYTFVGNNDIPVTKMFYASKNEFIDKAIDNYMLHLNWDNISVINQENANKKRSASMKLYHENKRLFG